MTSRVKWLLYDTDFNTFLGVLPALDGNIYIEINEPGSGNVTIPLDSTIAALIENGQVVECKIDDVGTGFFIIDNITRNEANRNEQRTMGLSGRGLLGLMDDAIVWDDGSGETTRSFSGSLGDILSQLLSESAARGGITFVEDFEASVTGSQNFDMEWGVGKSYLDVLRDFAALGFNYEIYFAQPFTGLTLDVWEDGDYGGTYYDDLSNTVYMRVGANVLEVDNTSEGGEIKNAYLVKYAGAFTKVSDATSITNYRRRESLYKIEAAPNALVGQTFGQAELTQYKNPVNAIKLSVTDNVNPAYGVSYQAGNTVSVDINGTVTPHVIYGAQLDFSSEGQFSITLDLNTIRRSHNMKLQRDVTALKNFYAAAQDEDKQVVSYWAAIGGREDTNERVYALKVDGGYLYAGGRFTHIANIDAACIARMNISTGIWEALGSGFVAGTPTAAVIGIEVIGTDVYASGTSNGVNGVYKWNGSSWSNIITSSGSMGADYYHALKKIGTGLYIGGNFSAVNGVANTNNIAKYSGGSFSALGTGLNNEVSSFEVSGSTLYAAGGFDTTSGGVAYACNRIAKWNGSAWSAVGSSSSSTSTVDYYTALCFVGTDLYFGAGYRALQQINGVTVHGLAKWDGSTWSDVSNGVSPLTAYGWDGVFALATDGINLYVGGAFTDADGITVNNIAVWNGGAWHQLGNETGADIGIYFTGVGSAVDGLVFALAMNNEDVYAGGDFWNSGGKDTHYITAYLTSVESVNNYLENSAYNSFDMAGAIHAATAKTAFVDADEIGFWDSVSSALRKITWANTKATLKTYFDTLYVALTGNQTIAGTKTFSSDVLVPDEAYDATAWNGSLEVPTKNAIRDKIETMSGGVSDGDKGDITVSSSGAVWTIDNGVVSLAKQADLATDKLIGRDTAGTGVPEAIGLGASLEFSGSGTIQRAALTGDVTASANSNATTISNNAVTFAKMQAITDGKLLGASGGTAVEEITVGTALSITSNTLNAVTTIDTHKVSKLRESDDGADALTASASGNLTAAGDLSVLVGATYLRQLIGKKNDNMADDTAVVMPIMATGNRYLFGIVCNDSSYFFGVNLYNSIAIIAASANFNVVAGSGALTGTTGTDGKWNIRDFNGVLYIENRRGGTYNAGFTAFGSD